MNNLIGKDPNILSYMFNATGGEKYDFKVEGVENKQGDEQLQHLYRGMPFEGVKNFGDQDPGVTTYASARDIGNVAAGYMYSIGGGSWPEARFGFDVLESVQQKRMTTEAMPTQVAQKLGYDTGRKVFEKTAHPLQVLVNPVMPYPPK